MYESSKILIGSQSWSCCCWPFPQWQRKWPPMTLESNFTNILLEYHHIAERQADVLKKTTQLVASRQKVIHRGGWSSQQKKSLRHHIWNTRNSNYKHWNGKGKRKSRKSAKEPGKQKRKGREREVKLAAKKEFLTWEHI